MDREENLEKMLPSWTRVEQIKDFVIVDWSSKRPVIENSTIQEQIIKHKNIKVIRVENQPYYHRCLALNLANSYTEKSNKILLKLDADYLNIDSSWLKFQSIQNEELVNYFICGDSFLNFTSTGFLFVNKRNFNEVNGYNENLIPMWGYEDEDIQIRLSSLKGLRYSCFWEHHQKNPEFKKIIFFDFAKYISHIDHTNETRVCNSICIKNEIYSKQFLNDKSIMNYSIMEKQTKLNREISIKNPTWEPKKYKIIEELDNYIRLEMI